MLTVGEVADPKRKRGGRHQRDPSRDPHVGAVRSLLAGRLLEDYAFGALSAIQVHKYADIAVKDGLTQDALLDLQRMGSYGKHDQNMKRDLDRYLDQYIAPLTTPKLSPHEIPLKVGKGPLEGCQLIVQFLGFSNFIE